MSRFTSDTSDGKAVAPIRGDRDVEHFLAQVEHRRGGAARLQIWFVEHEDPRVVIAETKLLRRTDHAVGDVPVCPARRYPEAPGQHRAGQRNHDEVADLEVVRTAHDTA